MDEFKEYKMLILSEITTLKTDFSKFKDEISDSVGKLQITIAVLNTKILMAGALTSSVVGIVVAYVMDKILK